MTQRAPRHPGAGPAPFVTAPCPGCGSSSTDLLHQVGDRFMSGPGSFEYVRCRQCALAYLKTRPRPEDLALYYPPGYIRTGRGPAGLVRAFRAWDLRPKLRLTANQPGRRVLDVGCARGDFLIEMRRRGYVVAGVEPAEWLALEALGSGLPVWPQPVAEAQLPEAAFDIVTLWDVIEHLADPVADLKHVARSMRSGGRLLVNTPVEDGWDARWLGHNWPGWDAPRHLTVFSRNSLTEVLERAGFRVLNWERVFESYLIVALAAGLGLRDRLPGPLGAIAWAGLHARPTRLVAAPVFNLLDRTLGGSPVAVVAERVE